MSDTHISLTPKPGCDRHTKEAVWENGPEFILLEDSFRAPDGKPGIRVRSIVFHWEGWLRREWVQMVRN